jgi:hypothetical protein
MLLNTFDFIEKPIRLVCYEKHLFILEEKMGSQYRIRQFSLGRIHY